MPYCNFDTGYRFSSPEAQRLCIEAVNLASKKANIHFTESDKAIAVRNCNIALLQEHMLRMRGDRELRQAHKTIAHFRQLNEESQAEGGVL